MSIIGTILVLLLLVLYAWVLVTVWRAPFRALGVLVAGMALHNVLLMVLIRLGTPSLLVKGVQFWKEGILILLLVRVALLGRASWQARRVPHIFWLDFVVLAFTVVVCIYAVLPPSFLAVESSLNQRLIGLRVLLLLPLLYAFGRIFSQPQRNDLLWVGRLILGSAGVVGLFGFWELWFVPTPDWLAWGVKGFTSWLGFQYGGPQGLPENFFQSTNSGYLLRRMVSTYISPLGIAYTGLLVVPMGAALVTLRKRERDLPGWFLWTTFTLLVAGILLSVTRGALISIAGEFALLCLLLRRRRSFATGAVVLLGVGFIFYQYVNIGPLLTFSLNEVRPPAGYALVKKAEALAGTFGAGSTALTTSGATPKPTTLPLPGNTGVTSSNELVERMINKEDPSARGHISALVRGFQYASKYPLGTGLGSSVPRFGSAEGPGESALLAIFGEIGVIGGLLYIVIYGAGIVYGFLAFRKVRGDHLLEAFALVPLVGGLALVPIMITSAIWGNFSVTFLFWWTLGFSVSLARSYSPEGTRAAQVSALSTRSIDKTHSAQVRGL